MILQSHSLLNRFRAWVREQPPERQVHIAGGAVRDLLMNRPVSDVDLVVTGDCRKLCEEFSQSVSARLVVVGQAFQSFRVIRNRYRLDFAPMEGGSIRADLLRRDITINAMALPLFARDPEDGLVDPSGGSRDVRNRMVRMVRAENLGKDPLRMLRVFRFEAELGFRIHPGTLRSVRARAGLLARVPGERVFPELKRTLSAGGSADRVRMLTSQGLLFALFPELMETVHTAQNRYHHLGVWDHTVLALEQADRIMDSPATYFPEHAPDVRAYLEGPDRRALLRLAVLVHDVAKPSTRVKQADGRVTFYGHEVEGAHVATAILKRLKAPRREVRLVGALVRNHLRIQQFRHHAPGTSTLVRLIREMDRDIIGLLVVGLADLGAKKGPARRSGATSAYLELASRVLNIWKKYQAPERGARPLLTGHDLMKAFSLPPSPRIGTLLEQLEEAFCDGRVSSREEALAFVENLLAGGPNSL